MMNTRWMALGMAALLSTACQERGDEAVAPAQDATAGARATRAVEPEDDGVDRWVGRWNGPEGTYLAIAKERDRYMLEIADLDGPRSYTALNVGDRLEFERNGMVERIRATDGMQTGMKWLQDKSDCLTIKPGEGYCRD